ncbi:MAG: rod-binding protein [Proteobacteria bacterium]|nr:rod-binding protein [Pseudomonadota bacterium]
MTVPPPLSTQPAPAGAPAPATPAVPQGASRAQLHQVATQFEALLVRQMLAAARSDGIGDALSGSGAMDNFRSMQDERFAEIAAQRGSFGLGRMIEQQLARRADLGGGG